MSFFLPAGPPKFRNFVRFAVQDEGKGAGLERRGGAVFAGIYSRTSQAGTKYFCHDTRRFLGRRGCSNMLARSLYTNIRVTGDEALENLRANDGPLALQGL